ncbi:M10 family metallopeptidase C-terminal domain-containing protein [Tardiphaga sp. 538_B7_N1_4]|uniref:M10 family metallopeptidase C-terminal domain-containing protein n=1 Tax=Tardiphaga sp. 538_B7_N1_4 TaxID=3240778 RepID=UPI003F20C1DD
MTQPTGTVAQLADYLVNGFWIGNGLFAHHWSPTTVTYNIDGLNAAEQFLAVSALTAWHEVANITFVQVHTAAQITYAHSGSMRAVTNDSYNGSGILTSATINISTDWITTDGGANDGKTGIDSYGFQTYLHETGHALGLGHQGPYNGSAAYGTDNLFANDTWQYSVMSYFPENNYGGSSYRYVVTPQMADIYAMATIYGASTTTRLGDTVYGFHSSAGGIYDFSAYSRAPALTIFDSGGNDTLDCSGYAQAQTINLNAGSFCSIGGLVGNIGIALSASIENAIGGAGNDMMTGSASGNLLHGGAGADVLYGVDGNDYLYGDSGNDYLDGGNGTDIAVFDGASGQYQCSFLSNGALNVVDLRAGSPTGSDLLFNVEWMTFSDGLLSTSATFSAMTGITFYGTASASNFYGTLGRDTVSYENASTSVIINLGANIVWHGTYDSLASIENAIGTAFADTIFGSATDNVLDGGAGGGDRFYGSGGNDTVSFAHATGAAIINLGAHATWNGAAGEMWSIANVVGSAYADTIFGDASDNVIDGGNGGGDRIYGGDGNDTVSFASSAAPTIVNLGAHATWNGFSGEVWSVENVIGTALGDTLFGDAGDNILDGGAGGGDRLYGGGGNDTASFSHATTAVIANLGAHATWNGFNGELWAIQNVTGSSYNDTIFGDATDNILDGGGGMDLLIGGVGNDSFVFHRGQAIGDTVGDFAGNGAAAGDQLHFIGYGLAADGATFTQSDTTHWTVNSADGLAHETITFAAGVSIHASDYFFI